MRHFEAQRVLRIIIAVTLAPIALACSGSDDHGPPVGAPTGPIVIGEGGSTSPTTGGNGGTGNSGGGTGIVGSTGGDGAFAGGSFAGSGVGGTGASAAGADSFGGSSASGNQFGLGGSPFPSGGSF